MPRQGLDAGQVVEEAVRIADADGLAAVTLARVSSALGVRAPSLYNHVAGHEALLRAIALRGLRELGDALRRAAFGRAREDALVAVAHAYRAYAHAHPGCFAATVAAPAPGDVEHEQAAAEVIGVVGVVAAAVGGWGLEDDDAIHAVRAVRSALYGFVAIEAAGGFVPPVDCDASFARLVRTLATGLEATAPAPA